LARRSSVKNSIPIAMIFRHSMTIPRIITTETTCLRSQTQPSLETDEETSSIRILSTLLRVLLTIVLSFSRRLSRLRLLGPRRVSRNNVHRDQTSRFRVFCLLVDYCVSAKTRHRIVLRAAGNESKSFHIVRYMLQKYLCRLLRYGKLCESHYVATVWSEINF